MVTPTRFDPETARFIAREVFAKGRFVRDDQEPSDFVSQAARAVDRLCEEAERGVDVATEVHQRIQDVYQRIRAAIGQCHDDLDALEVEVSAIVLDEYVQGVIDGVAMERDYAAAPALATAPSSPSSAGGAT